MRIFWCGDRCAILSEMGSAAPYRVAAGLQEAKLAGVVDCWASYETVGLEVDPARFDVSLVEEAVARAAASEGDVGRHHVVPVCYELGEDLGEAAEILGISPGQLVEAHCSTDYLCHAIGFCPGFPYLGTLPELVCGVPRREQPRVRVPAGSVGITGGQTGIYPEERPGGWALIGRTPLVIASMADEFFPIAAGDHVRFVSITPSEFDALEGKRLA